ncbi:hypothetical protein BSKO_13234 [Bryopsis sp. KO-2023]|nr:hypothetical protein BSKO_13234 [Bryopsis sp. KO-2023]
MVRLATAAQIEEHRDEFQSLLSQVEENSTSSGSQSRELHPNASAHVFARVRPVLPHETAGRHFKTVFAGHDGEMKVHMLSTTLKGFPRLAPSEFKVDRSFGASAQNADIYQVVCRPLVDLAKKGGSATLFAYGQTGSGKTYTVAGLVELAAGDLFVDAQGLEIGVSVVEILGSDIRELMGEDVGAPVQLLEDQFGRVQLRGCVSQVARNSDELKACISQAVELRRTEATEKNDTSSRSHMIIRISIRNVNLVEADEGLLCLVDLAGSESAKDTSHHSTDRLKETKLINTSLMTLKDCMRNRSAVFQTKGRIHIPYRASKLTLAMRDCFELAVRRPIKAAIIACVSPLEMDGPHSVNTLRYAAGIRVAPKQIVMEADKKDPMNWDRDTVLRFLNKAGGGLVIVDDLIPEGSGKTLVEIPEHEFMSRVLKAGTMSDKQAKELYLKLWKLVVDARSRFRFKQKNVTAAPPEQEEDKMEEC